MKHVIIISTPLFQGCMEKKTANKPNIKCSAFFSHIKSISCEKWDSVHKPTISFMQDGGPAPHRGKTDKALFPSACEKATREK